MNTQRVPSPVIVLAFLLAVVLANYAVAHYGQNALPFTAFLLVPFDLSARDVLHERWSGNLLKRRMAALVVCGGALSAMLAPNVNIATASAVSFALAGAADFAVYSRRNLSPSVRRVSSNAAGALVDSTIFPWLALGAVELPTFLAQTTLKTIGSALWVGVFYLLSKTNTRHDNLH